MINKSSNDAEMNGSYPMEFNSARMSETLIHPAESIEDTCRPPRICLPCRSLLATALEMRKYLPPSVACHSSAV